MIPQIAPVEVVAFPPDAHDERREITGHRERERPAHHGQNVPRLGRSQSRRHITATNEQEHARNGEPTDGRRVRVDHLVVDVVAERVGDGEQQPVGGGERRRKTAGGDQARDHVRQARDLRRGEHDHVGIDDEVLEPHDAGMTGNRLARVDDGLQAARHSCRRSWISPSSPQVNSQGRMRVEVSADDVGVDLELRERRIGRRREVEQEDEQQRPSHRLPRLTHRRGGEVAHQDVRQRRRADHHAEDDAEEVQRAVVHEGFDVRLERARADRPAAVHAPQAHP